FVLGVVMVGSLWFARDPAAALAFGLIGGAWGLWLAVLDRSHATSTAPVAERSAGPPAELFPLPNAPAGPRSPGAEQPAVGFLIDLRCPACGAVSGVPVYHRMSRCTFCGSVHAVVRPDRRMVVVIPDTVTSEATVREAVGRHLAHRRYLARYDSVVRPLLASRAVDPQAEAARAVVRPEGDVLANIAEAAVRREAEAYSARCAASVRISSWRRFLSPYWHCFGTLYQSAFGRDDSGEKRLEFGVATVEISASATSVPVPEMGKLSYLRALHPLRGSPEESLPTLPDDGDERRFTERLSALAQRSSELRMRALATSGSLVSEVDALVYRPWHAVEGELDGEPFGLLIEGGAGNVAGGLSGEAERAGAPAEAGHSPLDLMPSRCPECGADFPYSPDAVAHLCWNCYRVSRPEQRRWRTIPYDRAKQMPRSCLLPFWRFPLLVRTPSGEVVTDLRLLTDGIDGILDQPRAEREGDLSLFVPAFRTRIGKSGVRLYRSLWPAVQGKAHVLTREAFSPAEPPRDVAPITLPADEARIFGQVYLALAFGSRDLARADARRVRANFLGSRLESEPVLTFLPISRELLEPFRHVFGRPRPSAIESLEGVRRSS
ncbi:MAG: hypothetical protein AB1625_07075, partial [Acidobacteriota bacterium]